MLAQTALTSAQRSDLGISSTDGLVGKLTERYRERITGYFKLPAIAARFAPFPPGMSEPLIHALGTRGITQLYSHQREAWDALAAGHNTVVVTPTASGKSLCYHLPVIEAVRQSGAKAYFVQADFGKNFDLPAFAESMYDRGTKGRDGGGKVIVE